MFQDIQAPRSAIRSRRLVVPERCDGVVPGQSTQSSQYSYSVSGTLISDMVSTPGVVTVTESSVTSVQVEPVIEEVLPETQSTESGLEGVDLIPEKEPVAKDVAVKHSPENIKKSMRESRGFWARLTSPKAKRVASRVLVAGLVAATGYISVDTYLTNQELKRRLEALPAVAASADATPEQRQQAEGMDETEPAGNAMANYAVAPDMPRYIKIKKINVYGRVRQMGLNPDGSMQAPINIFDAGWYNGSSRPGAKGASVIDAHASGPSRQGLFAYLNTLTNGDSIEIERGDGSVLNYEVVHKEVVGRRDVDMRKVMSTYSGVDEGLNLITCDGKWEKNDKTFSDRTIVYTKRVVAAA